jgi:hypothetical protein
MTQPGYPLAPGEIAPSLALPFTGSPSPWEPTGLWDALYVSGVPWVGRVKIRGAKRVYKWDVKEVPGVEGFNQTYRGQPHQPFYIDLYIWTDSMYRYWINIYQKLFQYIGAAGIVLPVKVYHPSLTNVGITAIVADAIGVVEQVSEDLLYRVTLDVHEYYPPLPTNATSTPLAAAGINPRIPGTPSPSAAAIVALNQKALAQQAASEPSSLP